MFTETDPAVFPENEVLEDQLYQQSFLPKIRRHPRVLNNCIGIKYIFEII